MRQDILARRRALEHIDEESQPSDGEESLGEPSSETALLSVLPSPVHQQLLRQLVAVRQKREGLPETSEDPPNNIASFLIKNSARMMSKTVASLAANTSQKVYAHRVPQVACAAWQCMSMHWQALTAKVCQMLKHGYRGLVLARVRKYDESPFLVRVSEDSKEVSSFSRRSAMSSKSTANQGSTAKLVSTKHRLMMLLQSPSGQHCILQGEAPSRLHLIEAQKASHFKKCQEACLSDVNLPDDFAQMFDLCVSLPATDRFTSMVFTEKWLHHECPFWVTSHSFCSIHRMAGSQGHMCSLVPNDVTGMLSAALATQKAGSSSFMKDCLFDILCERVEIVHGEATCEEHRNSLYNLFLPLEGDDLRRHEKQRLMLAKYLNGNVQDRGRIIHMSTDTSLTRESLLEDMRQHLVPALLPQGTPPFYNRSKWLGAERAITWHGVLATHHDLHRLLFARWAGMSNVMGAAASRPGRPGCIGWAGVAASALGADSNASPAPMPLAPAQHVPAENMGDDEDPEPRPEDFEAEDQAKQDWIHWNKRQKDKAVCWSQEDAERHLIAMRIACGPFVRLLRRACHLSGRGWEKQQLLLAARGQPRGFRILELHYKLWPEYKTEVSNSLHSPVPAVPFRLQSRSVQLRGLLARFCSLRGKCV